MNKEMFKRLFVILFGCFLISVSINSFIIPHKLLAGGVSGLAIIMEYLSKIPAGIIVFAINIPIFIIGSKEVDKEFAIVSFIGMTALSLFLMFTKPISNYLYIEDLLASCILGGVVSGLGSGLIFRNRGSVGGTDIISVIVKKKYEISISTIMFGINILVVTVGTFINDLSLAVYTLICMFISSNVMSKIIEGFDRKKLLLIVTTKDKEVSNALIQKIKRGVTLLDGEGAFSGKKTKVLYCVISTRQLSHVKKIVNDIDDKSFMSILDTSEIHGKGFKKPIF